MAGVTKYELSVSALKKTRECADKYPHLVSMKLTGEENEDAERRSALVSALIGCLSVNDCKKALERWNEYMDNIYVKLPGVEFVEAGDTQRAKGIRFISWFFEAGYRVEGTNLRYAFITDSPAGEVKVMDRIHLYCKKEEKTVLMNLSWKVNPYSDKARKPDNLTGNAVELLSMMAGNERMRADTCICYLTSKKDTSKALCDEFEKKAGYNLAYLPFTEDAGERLSFSLSLTQNCDCESCYMRRECQAAQLSISERKKEKLKRTDVAVGYTPAQQKVVEFSEGQMCVVAVPGAGKTFALVERTKALIGKGIPADKILMVTFTKKATAEYANRVARSCPKGVQPDAFTLHALAHFIITEVAGNGDERKLATDMVRLSYIKEAVTKMPRAIRGMSYDYRNGSFGLYRNLDKLFKGIELYGEGTVSDHPDSEGVLECYKLFDEFYKEHNCFEYDDLIKEANLLLEDPEILQKVHDRWKFVMVDEVQDIDREQWEMICKIQNGNLVVVGDDDQEIYAWRGGSSAFMLNFCNYFQGSDLLYMEDNFRSTESIVEVAGMLSNKIDNRYGKVITPIRHVPGEPVYDAGVCDDSDIVGIIKNEIESGRKPEDICVLARTNKVLEALEVKLRDENIKAISPRKYLVNSPSFDMLYCLFRLYNDGAAVPETCLYRLLKYMGKTVSKEKGESLYEKYFEDEPETVTAALDALCDTEDIEEAVVAAYKAITGARTISEEVFQLLHKLREEEVTDFDELCEMMKKMIYFSDESEVEVPKKEGYVNLLTMHRAKGKEYPMVIVYGMETLTDAESDYRLGYVAVTRAQEVCIIARKGLEEAPVYDEIKRRLVPIEQRGAKEAV